MSCVSFVVPGDPVAKGRPRFVHGGVYTPRRTLDAESSFAWHTKAACRWTFSCPLELALVFHTRTLRRVDLDNLVKLASDAMNGIAYLDDSQIVSLRATRELDRLNPRTEVTLTAIERSAA